MFNGRTSPARAAVSYNNRPSAPTHDDIITPPEPLELHERDRPRPVRDSRRHSTAHQENRGPSARTLVSAHREYELPVVTDFMATSQG